MIFFFFFFNISENQGKTLAKPEIVPFRLTQNIVAAFGTGGLEGPFRKACEVTLELLRENSESLMIILESFLHDPLIEWKSKKKSHAELNENEMRNEAEAILKKIRNRLQGILEYGTPLSVSGQVEELIQQAMSPELLCRMYEGWLPHI
ncbi:hypothetical protein HMI54_002422 [Coelomomyces lativittatus]|nr:hypothetical protein HMI54_002422 [Coelomomyces lativittatus]